VSASRIIPGRILAHASAAALLGTRVFHFAAPQGTVRPYALYVASNGDPSSHLGGAGGLLSEQADVAFWSDTMAAVKTFREIVYTQLHGYRGSATVGPDTFLVRSCFIANVSEVTAPPVGGRQTPLFGLTFDVALHSTLTTL